MWITGKKKKELRREYFQDAYDDIIIAIHSIVGITVIEKVGDIKIARKI